MSTAHRNHATIRLKAVERIPSISILHHVQPDGVMWGSRGRSILKGESGGEWELVARMPFAFPRDLFGFTRPGARATRADKCNLYINRTGKVMAIRAGQVYRLNAASKLEPLFTIQGDCVLHGGICEDAEGWTYFGEYFMNPARESVVIWRLSPDMQEWSPAHRFERGSIRHVHGVYRDPYDPDSLWVTAGDKDGECFFYFTKDRFESVERVGDGSQLWRAVRLFFTPEHICWLTDSQLEQNVSCRMERRTGELELGQALEAPAWYGAHTLEGLFVAFTTVEPGPAVKRNDAAVLVSEDGFEWREVHQFEKDFWKPMKLFKYGVISCPSGSVNAGALPISGEGLIGLDGESALLQLDWGR